MAFSFAVMRYAWLFYPLLAGSRGARPAARPLRRLETDAHPAGAAFARVPRRSSSCGAVVLAVTNLAFGAAFLVAGTAEGVCRDRPVGHHRHGAALGLGGGGVRWPRSNSGSRRWKSFGAALALNVCLTLPVDLRGTVTEIGPWYPWAQPIPRDVPAGRDEGGNDRAQRLARHSVDRDRPRVRRGDGRRPAQPSCERTSASRRPPAAVPPGLDRRRIRQHPPSSARAFPPAFTPVAAR